jgi:hypothetical protein
MSWFLHMRHRYLYPMRGVAPHPSQVMPWCSPKCVVRCSCACADSHQTWDVEMGQF